MFGLSKRSIACAISTLFIQGAVAQGLATVPQADFGQYDCDMERDYETRHVGQYIQGQYMEWLESYGLARECTECFLCHNLVSCNRALKLRRGRSSLFCIRWIITKGRDASLLSASFRRANH